jgi:ATP/maltotriose-dependent transcriptional regulator MalT
MIAESSSSTLDQRELWRAVSDLRDRGDELTIEIGMLEMIYEINLGTIDDGIASADRLLKLLAATRDGYQRLSMILPISDALRVGGRYRDALKLAYDGAKLARETGSEHFEISALSRVIAIHTEIGELREAQALLPELEARVQQSGDEFARLTTYALTARIALFTGQTDEAKSWATRHYDIVRASAFDSRDRVRIAVTLLAEVLLSCGPQPLPATLLEELRAAHLACRTRPMHDQTMAVLYCALIRSGYGQHARDVLNEYLLYHRRAMNSWPESVARLKLAGIPELETASILVGAETVPPEDRGVFGSANSDE